MAVSKTTGFEYEGLVQQRKALDRLLLVDKSMKKAVQGIIRDVLLEARASLQRSAMGALGGKGSRESYRAVKSTVYRQILGGNVNILQRRKAGELVPPGGSHRARSQRTIAMQSYWGKDRGFILRWMNDGVKDRVVSHMNNHEIMRKQRPKGNRQYKSGTIGWRGGYAGNGWFSNSGQMAMERAAEELSNRLDQLIEERLKVNNNG